MTPALEQAYASCADVARTSGSSFYAGMRLLPADRRAALYAIYALARRIDDIADGALAQDEKRARLDAVRRELAALDRSEDPVLVAVADTARRYPVPLEAFSDLLEGAELDVNGPRFETFAELEHYCRCVAGSIGRLCLGVFEASDRAAADRLADELGVALQLGNILRDLQEDARRGRSYLPAEDIRRFGGERDLVVAFEAERALGRLERGLVLLRLIDRRSARCVRTMTAAYRRLLERMAADPRAALRSRMTLAPWEKRILVLRSIVGAPQ
jgi:phytoene synthase